MSNAQSLDNLKLKELAAIAESLKLSNWRRLSKSELRDLILQQPTYAKLGKKGGAGKPRGKEVAQPTVASEEVKPRKKAVSKSKAAANISDDSPASPPEERAAKKATGRGRKAAEPEKPAVRKASRSKAEKNADAPLLESVPVKSKSRTKAVVKSGETEQKAEAQNVAKTTVPAETKPARRRSVKETVADAMKKAAQTAKTGKSTEKAAKTPRAKKGEDVQTADATPPVRKTGRKRAVKEEDLPLLNFQSKEKPVEKKAARPSEKAPSEPSQDPVPAAKPKRGRKNAAAQPGDQTAAEENSVVRTRARKKTASSSEAKVEENKSLPETEPVVVDKSKGEESASGTAKHAGGRKRRAKTEKSAPETSAPEKTAPEKTVPEKTAPEKSEPEVDEPFVNVGSVEEPRQKAEPAKKPARPVRRPVAPHDAADFLRLSVCNSYWLLAQWKISENNTSRVRSAMGRLWHTAEPILRVYRVDKEPQIASVRRERVADVPVRLPIRTWYVPVENPPCSFMLELGYNSREGDFFTLASSNVVDAPPPLMDDSPVGTPISAPVGFFEVPSAQVPSFNGSSWSAPNGFHSRPFSESDGFVSAFGETKSPFVPVNKEDESFQTPSSITLSVGAEIVIKGRVSQGASVKIRDEKIPTKADGSFSVRLDLPERRHVFPVVATSFDDAETQTIILAIDRNTKTLDPIFKEDEE